MATQFKESNLNQVTQAPGIKLSFSWPLLTIAVMVTVMVALVVSFLLASLPAPENQTQTQRVLQAEAARYSGLAGYYLAKEEANQQRVIEAEAARYNGLAEFFVSRQVVN